MRVDGYRSGIMSVDTEHVDWNDIVEQDEKMALRYNTENLFIDCTQINTAKGLLPTTSNTVLDKRQRDSTVHLEDTDTTKGLLQSSSDAVLDERTGDFVVHSQDTMVVNTNCKVPDPQCLSKEQVVFPPAVALKMKTKLMVKLPCFDNPKVQRNNMFSNVTISKGPDFNLFYDVLYNSYNPNIVFINVLVDKMSGALLAIYLKNCHSSRYYWFDPTHANPSHERYRQQVGKLQPSTLAIDNEAETLRNAVTCVYRQRMLQQKYWQNLTPATALAEFVLQNTYSKHELVLVGSDGLLYDRNIVNQLFYSFSKKQARKKCQYCSESAEMVNVSHNDIWNSNGIRKNEYNSTELYSCTYHAMRNPSMTWYCYAPMLADMSMFMQKNNVSECGLLRLCNFRYYKIEDLLVAGEIVYNNINVADCNARFPNTSVPVDTIHNTVCSLSHAHCNDWIRNCCDPTRPAYNTHMAGKIEKLLCLLTPRIGQ